MHENKRDLEEMIDDLIYKERRLAVELPVTEPDTSPLLADLFAKILPTIEKQQQKNTYTRAFTNLLLLLPAGILVKNFKKQHYQIYIDWRKNQITNQTGKKIKITTVYKELYAISSALKKGELYFSELENWQKPALPISPEKKKSRQTTRRKRIVSPVDELGRILSALRDKDYGRFTVPGFAHQCRLADDLEFRYQTGLRRKEVARLKISQFNKKDNSLKNVIRWKTGTVTIYYPLSTRAAEIIIERIKLATGEYIFTPAGESIPSDYRTLITVCKDLGISYGRYAEDGFIAHDLRHNFASEIIQNTDIETARELLGHSNISQTGDYLHTTAAQMKNAVKRREGIELKKELTEIYKNARRRKLKLKSFLEIIKNLFEK